MEEAVPGASVCPTLTRLGETQTGNGALNDWLAAMKIVRRTNIAAANGRPFACRKVQRGCPPVWQVGLEWIFMGVFLPAIHFRAGEGFIIGAILSAARLRATLHATPARSALV